ncbi:Holliday junction branch migration protein RuvA [Pantoea sp. Nvir]|uniref:Holliday junction branch migration protein RuvA n=1 Tax=Pantoea sp. Nvir TaxID=2576760 RepID=UPI00135A6CFF|nr:Holliday junction branch migration protein RuvA [Pantoea sp. Nvir]MXP66658.1 Holliday junction branch migration protein RuvA [Pantoea sp. Nvir]CAJ0991924.1 Holliday junction ATP-dependent DNA helicase RuvA [Pantoea sp. Nvir]
MIGRLKGNILEKQPPLVLIEAHGVGYEVHIPMTCFYELPELNHEAVLFTHFVVREDAQLLFGFNNKEERVLFRELIKINGVGPKLALAILSGMSAQQFVKAVEKEEISTLIKLPSVGKKTAELLIVEMKDRFKKLQSELFSVKNCTVSVLKSNSAEVEAVAALVSLGYKEQEAKRMIRRLDKKKPPVDCETLIREALRTAI